MARPTESLWTDRERGSGHEWLAPGAPAARRPRRDREPEAPPSPPPAGSRRPGRAAVAGGLVVVLVALAVLAGTRLGGGGSAHSVSAGALPASSGRPAATRINEIYARVTKGVVSVQVAQGSGEASGTGFVIDGDGTIVTNAHVVSSAQSAQVRFDGGNSPVTAKVVGTDPSSDLAVLHVDPNAVGTLHPLVLANSDQVRVGDTAIAIGFPLGLDRTATAGIVSGVGREIQAPNGFSIDKVIQTDAPINPGNSGGPLLDARGRVIGVNSQIATAGGGSGNVGIGFAVPSNAIRSVVPKLKAGQTIERPYLGVSTAPSPDGRGALVRDVTAGGPADRAGIAAGDVIVAIDGTPIRTPDDVAQVVTGRKVGDSARVTLRHGGSQTTVTAKLARRPSSAP